MDQASSGDMYSASCLIVFFAFALAVSVCTVACPQGSDDVFRASILQEDGSPVAVIDPISEAVSNGTIYTLRAFNSYDTDNGTIESYVWEIEHANGTYFLYQSTPSFMFEDLGLYKIKLTVTDDSGKTGIDFTAVYSVIDADFDGMADWWEAKYGGVSMKPEADPDDDGYSNLEEYVHGTNPLVADPGEGIVERNWQLLLTVAVIVAVAIVATYPIRRKRRKEAHRKKVDMAIEIQKALDEE